MRLILKTMVSNSSELPFLWMMFDEAANFADLIIVTEFDQTHSGLPKPFIFEGHLTEFSSAFPQLIYLQGKQIAGVRRNAKSARDHHWNETLMRGWFARQLKLLFTDVVVSLDADEVLYKSSYRWLVDGRNFCWRGTGFRLHQFFYRPTFLWLEKEFIAPAALPFGTYSWRFPNNWRYQGRVATGYWGVHFSWCIPVEEMISKLSNYSHAAEYSRYADHQTLARARNQRKYIFDEAEDFRIAEISESSHLMPSSFLKYAHLIAPEVRGTE